MVHEKPNWFALSNTGNIVALGRHEDFESADEASREHRSIWIFREETAKEWVGVMYPNFELLLEAAQALEPLLTSFNDLRSGYPERELHEPADVTADRVSRILSTLKGEGVC
jgi:hypothetical protein